MTAGSGVERVPNWIDGQPARWSGDPLPVFDPARGAVIAEVPASTAADVDTAVRAAVSALPAWSRTSVMDRVAVMFRFKALLERDFEDLARLVTRHHGKTLDEARGEVRRGVEVVDFACGAPTLLQGRSLRSVSAGVDQEYHRYPAGVVAGITPFNFPVMIPLWMTPLALVCGNTMVLKPSERTPLGAQRLAELLTEAGLPAGVFNVLHGDHGAATALVEHDDVAAVSFVGSEPAARAVYRTAALRGKRVQALGGARNCVVVLPDADLSLAVPATVNAAFGNAGERCLAGSVAVTVGGVREDFSEHLASAADALVTGPGDADGVTLGPMIRAEHRDRVAAIVDRAVESGARLITDGRPLRERDGFFLGPTILDEPATPSVVRREEIFGPVLSVVGVDSLDGALDLVNQSPLGNMAVVFTRDGAAARTFRDRVEAGMVGVNVPIAQPFAFFPFSGWKRSFYGDLHIQGTDGVDFYTRKKMVVSRW